MVEARQKVVAGVLDELCRAVAADGGAALYLDDGEGALQRVAQTGNGGVRPPRLLEQLRDDNHDQKTLILTVPGTPTGVVVLNRKSGGNFTQQDRAVARLYVRRLAEGTLSTGSHIAPSVWSRRLEAIQRIGARLNRLGSVQEVGVTICRGTFDVIPNDEAHLLLADEHGYLAPIAQVTRDGDAALALPHDGPIARHIGRALTASMPVLENSVLPKPDSGRDGPHSLLIVPLFHEGRVNGLLCLIAAAESRFDDDHLRLLQILSDQAAVAIENARLLTGRDELVAELASLLEVSEAAGGASDQRHLATQLAARMRGATEADGARVSRWEEGSTVLHLLGRDGVGCTDELIELADSPIRWTALRDGRAHVIQVDSLDHDAEGRALRADGTRTLIVLPLTAGGRTIGLVELLSRQSRTLNESQLHALEAMASLTATGLERVRLVEQLRSAADSDLVTGVHNHRYLQERLRQEVARAARQHGQLAVLYMDLDKFKQVNDRHGHADGDGVLHNIGATIMAELRANDVVARYGGDEFVVIMPDTAPEQAQLVADRVVNAIINRRHKLSDGAQVSVGVSAGMALYPTDGRTTAELLAAADAAMYGAKRGGRGVDRSVPAPSLMEPVAPAS